MVAEMKKLRELLDAEGIEWKDRSNGERDIDRTHFWFRKYHWSVVNGYGSYGGYIGSSSRNEGLLEMMSGAVNGGDPIGWLTAEEVMKFVKGEEDEQVH